MELIVVGLTDLSSLTSVFETKRERKKHSFWIFLAMFTGKLKLISSDHRGLLYDQSAPERKINLVLIERIQFDENMEFNNMAYQEMYIFLLAYHF